MTEIFTPAALTALFQVVIIDLSLAGDNAIVVGIAAAGLPKEQRTRAIVFGMAGATVLLILFAAIATQLLQIVGLLFAGGVLLLWVCWKMWRELRSPVKEPPDATEMPTGGDINADAPRKTLRQAALQIIFADVSMSLDNVLAVAGAARDHPLVLVFGLTLSIITMGVAATFIARLLQKHRWLTYLGLAVVLYVALEMVYRGLLELLPTLGAVTGLQ